MSREVIDRLSDLTRPTGEETKMNVSYPRLSVSPKLALAAAAVVAVIIGLVVAHALFRGSPDTLDAPALAHVGAEEETGGEIVVSVVGEVHEPGLVTLVDGARIADALTAAGGLTDGADSAALNQAQLIVDGQQIVVPAVGAAPPPGATPAVSGGGGGISLNSADASELTTLKGIGEATAAAIIAYREEHGGFREIDELLEVSGIGPAKFEALKDEVTL